MTRVLITRPEPGASRTFSRLEDLGFSPQKFVLTEIEALETLGFDGSFDLVIATSAQAFLHLPDYARAKLVIVPCCVVGPYTAVAARDAGFANIQSISANLEELLAELSKNLTVGIRIIYLCGRVRRPELELALAARALDVTVIEIYNTSPVADLPQRLTQALAAHDPQAVLVTSLVNAQILATLLKTEALATLLCKAAYFCISQRVADPLAHHGKMPVFVAATPDENGLIALLLVQYPISS